MRDEHRRDGAVVLEEVALGDPLVRPEELVEVRERKLPLAGPDDVGGRPLVPHLGRRLVLSEALVRGLAHVPVMRPLAELDLGHEARLDPGDVSATNARHPRRHREGRLGPFERSQQGEQASDLAVVEPRADVAGVSQLAAVVDGQDERAERGRAVPRASRVSGDHELLAAVRLDLQPVATPPPLRIARALPLGHDSLEPLALDGLVERQAVVEHRGEAHGRIRAHQLGQELATLLERPVDDRRALGFEAVEGVVDEPARALLHGREARVAAIVECAHLAVHHRVANDRVRDRLRHGREPARQIVAVARAQLAFPATDVRERAVAVELQLVEPVAPRRERVRERGEHRLVHGSRGRLDGLRVGRAPDQQPVLLLAVQVSRHERPDALEALAAKAHLEPAVILRLEQLVGAVIPDLDGSRAVGALRDLAGEGRVVERVILDVNGQGLRSRLDRHPFRDRPGRQRAVALQAEVVVEAARRVLLDDEHGRAAAALAAERLRGGLRVAFLPVLLEFRHSSYSARSHAVETRLKTLWIVWRKCC